MGADYCVAHAGCLFAILMTFDATIKDGEQRKLWQIKSPTFSARKDLRKGRNKGHVEEERHKCDTDNYNFEKDELIMMKDLLYIILTSTVFGGANKNANDKVC